MPHSYLSCLMHYVFSTKNRRKMISTEVGKRLWAYIGGIARENGMRALAVGGTQDFAWQQGYGAFSIGLSGLEETVAYISNQEQHHHTRTFEDEFVAFLKRHGIDYNERYVFG